MQVGRGIILKLLALALFSVMAALVKAASDVVPPGQAVFFRAFFALPVVIAWLWMRGELRDGLKTQNPSVHFWRGLVGVTAMGCGFTALGLLPLPEVTAIGFSAPLLTVILAALLLGERIRAFRIGAVMVGLVGVMVIIWPRLTIDINDTAEFWVAVGTGLALLSAALRAFVQVHIRRMVQTETTAAIVFYFLLSGSILSLLTLPYGWVWPAPVVLVWLVLAGMIGGAAQIFLTASYRFAPASVLAPFDYSQMIYAIVIGFFIFDEVPTVPMLIGTAIVIASGALIIWRERQLGIERGKARPNIGKFG